MSLILTNGHRAVNTPRALAPEYKELGGMHIPASGPPPLPKDLKDFLDSSENGVIYFSLGSQINMSTLPNEVLMSFYEAFERVPQRILWKCIESNMPRLPKKVKCIEWAPQLSILCTYIYIYLFFLCVCGVSLTARRILFHEKKEERKEKTCGRFYTWLSWMVVS